MKNSFPLQLQEEYASLINSELLWKKH